MEKWPNFFIVGAGKAGTTALYSYLNKIPMIYLSKVKEPGFFAPSLYKYEFLRTIKNKKQYLELFKEARNELAIGEASPAYLWDLESAHLIHEVVPHAKIVIILRNPIERTFSHYLQLVRHHNEAKTFHDIIHGNFPKNDDQEMVFKRESVTKFSFYYESVKSYFEIFGTKQVKILIFEEFVEDTKKTVEDVLDFLGISYELDDFKGKKINPYFEPRGSFSNFLITNKITRKFAKKFFPQSTQTTILEKFLTKKATKPEINSEDWEFLKGVYKEDVMKTEQILKRSLPWD